MHANYALNVFINCPFDDNYNPLLKVLLFTVCYYKFKPRIALEQSDSSKVRLEKILDIIDECKYGIHDLSRIKANKKDELFRFNMPFELGLDFGSKRYASRHSDKALLVMVKTKFDYMKSISDLNGIDVKDHNGIEQDLIEKVREWFIETVGLRKLDAPLTVWYNYSAFQTKIFEDRFEKYYKNYNENTSEKMAKQDVDKMPIPEFIDEINSFITS